MNLLDFFSPRLRDDWNELFDAGSVSDLQVALFSLHVKKADGELIDTLIDRVCDRLWNLGQVPGILDAFLASKIQDIWTRISGSAYLNALPEFESKYGSIAPSAMSVFDGDLSDEAFSQKLQDLPYEMRFYRAFTDERFMVACRMLSTPHVWLFIDELARHIECARVDKDTYKSMVELIWRQGNPHAEIINAFTVHGNTGKKSIMDLAIFRQYDGVFLPDDLASWMKELHRAGVTERMTFLMTRADAATFDAFVASARIVQRMITGILFQAFVHHHPSRYRHLRHRPEWAEAYQMWVRAGAMRRRVLCHLPREINKLIEQSVGIEKV